MGKGWKDYGIGRGYKCERARAYFIEPNRDFALVCHYAGFDHEYVRMKAIKYFNREYEMTELRDEHVRSYK